MTPSIALAALAVADLTESPVVAQTGSTALSAVLAALSAAFIPIAATLSAVAVADLIASPVVARIGSTTLTAVLTALFATFTLIGITVSAVAVAEWWSSCSPRAMMGGDPRRLPGGAGQGWEKM